MSEHGYRVTRVGVVGAGLMGTGIAEVAMLAGLPTVLIKHQGGSAERARGRIERSLARQVERGKISAADAEAAARRLTLAADRDALAGCDLVVEAIVEDLDAKRALLADLAARLPTAVLATNTSTLRLTDLVPAGAEDRFVGLHFFSPVPAMALVEVARLATTRDDVLAGVLAFVDALGKTAVPVADTAGFIVNRLLVPYLLGAIAAFGQGLAPAPSIDTAMKLGCSHPMGPLALADLIGLDVVFAMAKLLYRELGDARYRAPALLRRMIQANQLGKKTGIGFYDYTTGKPVANQALWRLVKGDEHERAA
jgi:3-hydroxybutyryl-CoA dehydrogenase